MHILSTSPITNQMGALNPSTYQNPSYLSNLGQSSLPIMQGLPHPPPSIGYDVNEFRRFFTHGLSQLKHNNKYIINDLTTLASVYHHRMSVCIVKDIEQHIRESHPAHRLIGFYVLDSICKNLGHPFPELFKPFIERLFLTAYRDVEEADPTTKVKFEELLGTWKTGSIKQSELFGAEVQRRIEDGVFGSWRRSRDLINSQAFLNGLKQQPAIATPDEKASILYDLRRILSERGRLAASYPNDTGNLAQMATLQQLEQLVANQQLTINQVEDIRQQLQPLKPSSPPPAQIEYVAPQTVVQAPMHSAPTPLSQPVPSLTDPLTDPTSLANLTRLLEANPGLFTQAASQPFPSQALTIQQLPVNPQFLESINQQVCQVLPQNLVQPAPSLLPSSCQPLGTPNLYDSQQLAAALASLNAHTPNDVVSDVPSRERSSEIAHAHSPAPSTLSNSEGIVVNTHPDPAIVEYENLLAKLPIQLQSASINRMKPEEIADVIYSRIPQFCRQDGSRFLYGKTGDQRASQQLDRHFRLQRQVRELGQRAQQRMWSQLESSWLESHDFGTSNMEDAFQGNRADDNSSTKEKRAKALQENSLSELKNKSVVRPSSPGLASRPCPICREPFETRFDEEEDEFYWMNAIEPTKETGKRAVYHATCHYETMRNKARIKIKNELAENRLKRKSVGAGAVGKDQRRGGKVHSQVVNSKPETTPASAVDDNCLLQVDDAFLGGNAVPNIKIDPDSPPRSTIVVKAESPIGEGYLRKRKSSPVVTEVHNIVALLANELPSSEVHSGKKAKLS